MHQDKEKEYDNSLTDFVVSYGDIVEVNFPKFDPSKYYSLLDENPNWRPYNPSKPGYNRYGLSVTSLDGTYTGPDLDSLIEHYKKTEEMLWEGDFNIRTPISYEIPEVSRLCDYFGEDLGRSHFLKLDAGGWFPPHRDHNWKIPNNIFRVLVPFRNFDSRNMSWIFDDKIIKLEIGKTYIMNTTKLHSLFAYDDGCTMLILNVSANRPLFKRLIREIGISG